MMDERALMVLRWCCFVGNQLLFLKCRVAHKVVPAASTQLLLIVQPFVVLSEEDGMRCVCF